MFPDMPGLCRVKDISTVIETAYTAICLFKFMRPFCEQIQCQSGEARSRSVTHMKITSPYPDQVPSHSVFFDDFQAFKKISRRHYCRLVGVPIEGGPSYMKSNLVITHRYGLNPLDRFIGIRNQTKGRSCISMAWQRKAGGKI